MTWNKITYKNTAHGDLNNVLGDQRGYILFFGLGCMRTVWKDRKLSHRAGKNSMWYEGNRKYLIGTRLT